MKPIRISDLVELNVEGDHGYRTLIPFTPEHLAMTQSTVFQNTESQRDTFLRAAQWPFNNDDERLFLACAQVIAANNALLDMWFNTVTKGKAVIHFNFVNAIDSSTRNVASTNIIELFPDGTTFVSVESHFKERVPIILC